MPREIRISARTSLFTESVIREMTRLAMEHAAIMARRYPKASKKGQGGDAR